MSSINPRPCPVCLSVGEREVLYRQRFFEGPLGDGYNVCVCEACGAGFADEIPSQLELDEYYAEQSKYTYAHREGFESPYDRSRFEKIADDLQSFVPAKDARILDVGCATGGLLDVLHSRGYHNLYGSDPSPACVQAARARCGATVWVATIAELAGVEERFEAVLLTGVLEHIRDVFPSLVILKRLLAPNGLILAAQPDAALFGRCSTAPFQQFSIEHINYFSETSLRRLFRNAGLTSLRTSSWLVEWRSGVYDSVLCGVFSCADSPPVPKDEATRASLLAYIQHSTALEVCVRRLIDEMVRSQKPFYAWGCGSQARRLLRETNLEKANILAFTDSDAGSRGGHMGRFPIIAPTAIQQTEAPILVVSQTFFREIADDIREKYQLPNQVLSIAG